MPLALPILLAWLSATASVEPVVEAEVVRADLADGRVVVFTEPENPLPDGTQLILTADTQPLGWLRLGEQEGGRAVFIGTKLGPRDPRGALRAWLVSPDLEAQWLPRWPADASRIATIDQIGPGARAVWIHAGTNQGVQPGDCWWLRIAGQPVARFETRSVEKDVCFCAVVPLAAGLSLTTARRAELWPTPGQRRRGIGHTAVAFVERQGDAIVVWVAAPRHVLCSPEPHLDFYDRGRYLGHGVVEARDDLFWYARLMPAASGPASPPQPPRTATRPAHTPSSVPASAPAMPSATEDSSLVPAAPAADPNAIQVGDTAVVRTRMDIEGKRFVARVFEIAADGALINAGENDGLTRGDTGTLVRAGVVLGQLEVLRAQRAYSVVRATRGTDRVQPAPGDIVRFRPPPAPPVLVATVDAVDDGTLFTVRLASPTKCPLRTPLAVRAGGHTIGVGTLLTSSGSAACGFALESSLETSLKPGDELWLEETD